MRLEASAPFQEAGLEGTGEEAATQEASAAERAADINARVQGWAYAIPGYKHDTLVKRMEDLLKQPDDGATESP